MGDAPYRDPEWLREKYIDQRMSSYQIGELADVSHTTIVNWLERHDIPRRRSGHGKSFTHASYIQRDGYGVWDVGDSSLAVHRLAAVAWFGVDEVAGLHVHHENGHKFDNRESNLSLKTNRDHGIEHHGDAEKPHHDPEWLQNRLDEGMTQAEIADEVGVSQPTISSKIQKYGIEYEKTRPNRV
jgi:DNA-binding XRE family transcriptional regulator